MRLQTNFYCLLMQEVYCCTEQFGDFATGVTLLVDELRDIETNDFDLLKLIRLCEELNSAFQNDLDVFLGEVVRILK